MMIRHVVAWKFRAGEEENMNRFLSGLKALNGVIPEIRSMQVGVKCTQGSSFDACLIADFDDEAALSRYKNDPRHVAVASICKAIRDDRVSVDFEV